MTNLLRKASGSIGGLVGGGTSLDGVSTLLRPCSRASFSSRFMRRSRISATDMMPLKPGMFTGTAPRPGACRSQVSPSPYAPILQHLNKFSSFGTVPYAVLQALSFNTYTNSPLLLSSQ